MSPLLHNVAVIQHQNEVGVHDGAEPVGDDEAGSPLHQLVHGLLHQYFRPGVHVGGGLVQNQQRTTCQQRTGDGQQLLLPAGKVGGVLADQGVVAVWHGADKVVAVCFPAGKLNFLPGGVRLAVGHVLGNGTPEQPCILQNHAEIPAHLVPG